MSNKRCRYKTVFHIFPFALGKLRILTMGHKVTNNNLIFDRYGQSRERFVSFSILVNAIIVSYVVPIGLI